MVIKYLLGFLAGSVGLGSAIACKVWNVEPAWSFLAGVACAAFAMAMGRLSAKVR